MLQKAGKSTEKSNTPSKALYLSTTGEEKP